MRVVWPFLALLLAGLSSFSEAAAAKTSVNDKEEVASAEHAREKRGDPSHLHPRDTMPGRTPIVSGPVAGGKQDVTGSNDEHVSEVSEFAADYLKEKNSELTFVQIKVELQVVAGLMYTLYYQGNDAAGECKEKRTLVVYDKPWLSERILKSETVTECT